MKKYTMEELENIVLEELNVSVEFQESILMDASEIEDVVAKNPNEDKLVHTHLDENDNAIMLLTSDEPYYIPWCLLTQNSEGKIKVIKFFE